MHACMAIPASCDINTDMIDTVNQGKTIAHLSDDVQGTSVQTFAGTATFQTILDILVES